MELRSPTISTVYIDIKKINIVLPLDDGILYIYIYVPIYNSILSTNGSTNYISLRKLSQLQ